MSEDIEKVILREDQDGYIEFFFPERYVGVRNNIYMECFTFSDGHGECCYEYYKETKPLSPELEQRAEKAIADYEHLYDCKLERIYRDTSRLKRMRFIGNRANSQYIRNYHKTVTVSS
jgi:hypothetical protein